MQATDGSSSGHRDARRRGDTRVRQVCFDPDTVASRVFGPLSHTAVGARLTSCKIAGQEGKLPGVIAKPPL